MNRIAKTMLSCYNSISTLVNRIDRLIYNKAVKSHSNSHGQGSTLYQMERIVTLINVKNDLLLLRKITAETLSILPKKQRVLLVSKFIEQMSCEQIQQTVNISMRTLFRQINASINSFVGALMIKGFDKEWFLSTYLSQRWIKHIYNRCCDNKAGQSSLSREGDTSEFAVNSQRNGVHLNQNSSDIVNKQSGTNKQTKRDSKQSHTGDVRTIERDDILLDMSMQSIDIDLQSKEARFDYT